jgi:hypothetical protein
MQASQLASNYQLDELDKLNKLNRLRLAYNKALNFAVEAISRYFLVL